MITHGWLTSQWLSITLLSPNTDLNERRRRPVPWRAATFRILLAVLAIVLTGEARAAVAFWCESPEGPVQIAYGYTSNNDCGIVKFVNKNPEIMLSDASKVACLSRFKSLQMSSAEERLCSAPFYLPRRSVSYLDTYVRATSIPESLATAAENLGIKSEFSLIAAMPIFKIFEIGKNVENCSAAVDVARPDEDVFVCPVSYKGGLPKYIVAIVSQTNQDWLGMQSRYHFIVTPDSNDGGLEYDEDENLLGIGTHLGDMSSSACNLDGKEEYVKEVSSIDNGIIYINTFDGVQKCEARKLVRTEKYVVVEYEDGSSLMRLKQ